MITVKPLRSGFMRVFGMLLVAGAGLSAGGFASESRISIRLSGGVGFLNPAEVNTGIKDTIDLHTYELGFGPAYKNLSLSVNLGVDVIYYLTPKIGIGVGTEYTQAAKQSIFVYWDIFSGGENSANPKISGIPIKAGLFFRLPISEKTSLAASLGAGYYRVSLENTYIWQIMYVSSHRESFKVAGHCLGLHGAIGFERPLSSRHTLFFGVQGRWAKSRGLKGTVESNGNAAVPATLYSYDAAVDSTVYHLLDAMPTAPIDEMFSNVREAAVDLSGIAALVGIVIRF